MVVTGSMEWPCMSHQLVYTSVFLSISGYLCSICLSVCLSVYLSQHLDLYHSILNSPLDDVTKPDLFPLQSLQTNMAAGPLLLITSPGFSRVNKSFIFSSDPDLETKSVFNDISIFT